MSRTGRKRKLQRESGNRPVRERAPSPQEVARAMPHRKIVGDDAVHDPRCETPIGCLAVIGAIPGREYGAAMRLQGIVHRFRQAVAVPRPVGSIAGISVASEYHEDDAELPETKNEFELDPKERATRLRAYREARKCVENACGPTVWEPVTKIAVDGQPVPAGGFAGLKRVLRVLSAHFEDQDRARRTGD